MGRAQREKLHKNMRTKQENLEQRGEFVLFNNRETSLGEKI